MRAVEGDGRRRAHHSLKVEELAHRLVHELQAGAAAPSLRCAHHPRESRRLSGRLEGRGAGGGRDDVDRRVVRPADELVAEGVVAVIVRIEQGGDLVGAGLIVEGREHLPRAGQIEQRVDDQRGPVADHDAGIVVAPLPVQLGPRVQVCGAAAAELLRALESELPRRRQALAGRRGRRRGEAAAAAVAGAVAGTARRLPREAAGLQVAPQQLEALVRHRHGAAHGAPASRFASEPKSALMNLSWLRPAN